ncbi:MAG: HD domain-containing protein [Candidatus Pacebacteria bacterium]|nr:HD domain-containing protein [Candidatus Paceibacterota bacterium]
MLHQRSEGLVFPPENLDEVIEKVREVEATPIEERYLEFERIFIDILLKTDARNNPESLLTKLNYLVDIFNQFIKLKPLQKAIELAVQVHADQQRKVKKISVLSHIISVSYAVGEVETDVDVVTAAVLHDVLEDSIPPITPEDLRKKGFSLRVIRMIVELTEQKKPEDDEILDKQEKWWLRKKRSVSHLKVMSHKASIVKAADTIHFLRDLASDCDLIGVEDATKFFKVQKTAVMGRYQAMIQIIESRWPDHPLLPDMKAALQSMMDKLELEIQDLEPEVEKFINHQEEQPPAKEKRVELYERVRMVFITGIVQLSRLVIPF